MAGAAARSTAGGAQVTVVAEWREAITAVGEQQSLVESLRQSAHYAMFADQIEGWGRRLAALQEGTAAMSAVQRKWRYLEPVFARGALPEHAAKFWTVRGRPAAGARWCGV